jgi:hypothetical protein
MFDKTFLNKEMTKVKVVNPDKFYNFGIHDFFS